MGLWSDPETLTIPLRNLTAEVTVNGVVHILSIPDAEMVVKSWVDYPVDLVVTAAMAVRSSANIVVPQQQNGVLYSLTPKETS